ncbi:MAG: coiled-coil domain-containing protein [Desulfobaccales bacterium]
MTGRVIVIWLALAISFGTVNTALAQDQAAAIEELRKEMKELHQEVSAKDKKIEELERRLDAVQKTTTATPAAKGPVKTETAKAEVKPPQPTAPPAAATAAQTAATGQLQEQVEELKEQVGQVVEAQKQEFLAKFNPSIGFVGESIGAYRSQPARFTNVLAPGTSPRPGGGDFFQRSMELNIAGSIDPFARGYAVLNASADPVTGEATAAFEEAALVTTSLPWNLTLKAGRFFGEFGRLAYIHDHELPFVWRPLALDSYIGGESRTDGAQINWLLPLSHYVSLTAGAGNSFGGQPNNIGDFRQFTGFNFWGRASTYFDITPDIAIEPGFSWLFNPNTMDRGGAFLQPDGNSLTERERRLLGADFMVRYQPLRNNQFKSLTWGTEVLYSHNRYNVTAPDGTLLPNINVPSYGLYSYVAYRFHREWTAGFEFQWAQNAQDKHQQTYTYSPYITWYISHWNMLRLQYTYTQPYGKGVFEGLDGSSPAVVNRLRDDNAVYLQWAWIIGSHAHGWQER